MSSALNVRFFELPATWAASSGNVVWDFEYNPNTGLIRCHEVHEDSNPVWCEHVEASVTLNADASAIWEPIGIKAGTGDEGDPVLADEMKLDIPMFPTVGLWANVSLLLVPRLYVPMYTVEWSHPYGASDQFIGNITRGEGRRTIREMLVEFMWAAPDREVECRASHHGLRAQIEWQKLINSEFRTREAWSIYLTDWCTYCNLHRGDDSDLIPESENNGVWK